MVYLFRHVLNDDTWGTDAVIVNARSERHARTLALAYVTQFRHNSPYPEETSMLLNKIRTMDVETLDRGHVTSVSYYE